MSETRPICPLLDSYLIGDPISDHNGIQCCPAVNPETNEKFFVKIISLPSSQTQLDALLLTGALKDENEATKYYSDRANELIRQIDTLQQLARQEGFLPYVDYQAVPSENGIGQTIFIVSQYKRTLLRQFTKKPVTHLEALNLSLDICSALTACRRSGFLYVNLKPSNIYITTNGEYKINDHSFLPLNSLKYAAIDEHCISSYTPPEITDAYSSISDTMDVYAIGMILYEIFNGGKLPEDKLLPLPAPEYADEEIAKIILKACSIDPAERWNDPMQMGQALVSYMQKNGAYDTPIVPPAPDPEPETVIIPDVITEPDIDKGQNSEILTTNESVSFDEHNNNISTDSENSNQADCSDIVEAVQIPSAEEEIINSDGNDEQESSDTEVTDSSENVATNEEEIITANNASDNDIVNTSPEIFEIETPEVTEISDESVSEQIPETDENAEEKLMEILQNHDAFSDEVAQIKAAAVYLDIDHTEEPLEDISYGDISEEVVQILSQADALAAIDVPEPVVAPEGIEVKLPEAPPPTDIAQNSETETPNTEEQDEMKTKKNIQIEEYSTEEKPRKAHWIRNLVIILILLLSLLGGFLFYQLFMLKTVDQLELLGNKDSLLVQIDCNADDSLLSVSCEEKYGKTIIVPVNQGVAEFTGLKPDMEYTIRVDIAGIHVLSGKTTDTYYTPKETTVVDHKVNIGKEQGTAELSFIVEGPNSDRWTLEYSTPGYASKTITFNGNSVMLTDLLPNKTYTGILEPETDLFIIEPIKIDFTASEVIEAKNLRITSCNSGKLTVEWDAPETLKVDNWTVQCYSGKNGASYNQTVTTNKTSYEFKGLNSAESFTVIVIAEGQSSPQSVTIGANSVTVTDLTTDTSIAGIVNLTWQPSAVPANGWIISYTINNSAEMQAYTTENHIVIDPVVPNAQYTFSVQSADAVHTFCESVTCQTKGTDDFSININNHTITAADLEFSMIKQLDGTDWSHIDLSESDYTDSFEVGDRAGFVVFLKEEFEESSDNFNATFVICNDKGEIVSVSSKESVWNSAWLSNYCILKIPTLPEEAGYYTVTVYLNSQFAKEVPFIIK